MAGFLDTLFGGGAEKEAADKDKAALAQYQGQATSALGTGYSTGSTALNSAIGAYTPLANLGSTYSSGAGTLMGGLGIGTPDQVAAARSAFTVSPGYSWQMDQGLQALARQHAAAGNPNSGNADIDAITYGQGLANQDYGNWLSRLTQTGQMGIGATGTAAAGQAGGYGSLANLATQYGEDQSGVFGNVAQGNVAANNLQAAGEAAGAKNLLSAGLSVASLAMGMPPGGTGSSLLSSLGTSAGSAGATKGQPFWTPGTGMQLFGG